MMRRAADCCGNCEYFKRLKPMQPLGNCRAEPPTLVFCGYQNNPITQKPEPLTSTFWPIVPDTEWCGAHEHHEVRPVRDVDLAHIEAKEIEGNA